MNYKQRSYLLDLSSLTAGVLTVLAFAPFYWSSIAFITPGILLICWLNVSAKRAAWQGLLFGIGLFGFGASWIFISIHEFGNTNLILASLMTGILVFTLALFPALQGYLLNRFWRNNNLIKILIVFPAIWTLFEWLREWLLTGFPWFYLGTSQVNGMLAGFAPLIGTFGCSFLVAFCSTLLVVTLIYQRAVRYLALAALVILLSVGMQLISFNWTHPTGQSLTVSLIQGNVSQTTKWSPSWAIKNIQRYHQLTRPQWGQSLIIWPENAVPIPYNEAPQLINRLNHQAKQHHTTLLIGMPFAANNHYYNGLLALGASNGHYYKRHLVPFGEYVPFASLLRGLIHFFNLPMSSFIPGAWNQPLIKLNQQIPIASYICYEVAYSNLVRSDLPQAKLLVTISDDAWFGHSFAAWQHLQIAQMQALSTGRTMLFSTNNGVTAIINAKGNLIQQAPRFKPMVLNGTARLMTGATPWVLLGNTPIILLMALLLILGFCIRNKK